MGWINEIKNAKQSRDTAPIRLENLGLGGLTNFFSKLLGCKESVFANIGAKCGTFLLHIRLSSFFH